MSDYTFVTQKEIDQLYKLCVKLLAEREAFEKVAADFADRFYDGDPLCARKVQEEARRLLSRPQEAKP